MVNKKKNNFKILLVEDNPADVRLTKEVIQKTDLISQLDVVKDGVEAIDYMKRFKISREYVSGVREQPLL